MTVFKKNDLVTLVGTYDRLGTACVTHAIVEACGKKKMTLRSVSGEMLGNNFAPQREQGWDFRVIIPTSEYTESFALDLGARASAHELAQQERSIERNANNPGYVERMRAEIAKHHEPRVIYLKNS